jgi:carbonic anhydrase
MIDAREALARLKEGNRRFTASIAESRTVRRSVDLPELVEGQHPFAVVLGCSDSRVPVELVFDQGPGDLFVIRIAGNIVAPTQIGSVEFAASHFGTRLVVVLGHTFCGAVQAALDDLRNEGGDLSRNVDSIVARIRPVIEGPLESESGPPLRRAVRANVRASVAALRDGSDLIRDLVRDGGLEIVGAVYSLETGEVEFLD